MNILLFQPPGTTPFLVTETLSPNRNVAETASGRWGQLRQRIHQTYWELTEKLDHQENLCAQLRHADRLQIYHASRMESPAADEKFRSFLRFRHGSHGRWLCVDAVLAFFGIFLTPIPGPNLFFFYPAARTLGHYLARKGARRALSLANVSFQKDALIDSVEENLDDKEKLVTLSADIEKRYNVHSLEHILSRLRGR